MAGRPLLGMAIVIHLMTVTYETRSLRAALRWSLGLSLTIGIMGLTMTQWNEKSAAFSSMIAIIPRIERVLVPTSLNPNEIGGALAWVVPLSGGLIAYPWGKEGRLWWVLCIISFFISLTALLCGQSRFAIGGVILALAGIAWFLLQPPWRRLALIGVGLLFVLEAAVLLNLVATSPATEEAQIEFGLTQRDTDTSMQRLQIWDAALRIIYRYPVTGAGMDRFRSNEARLEFPVTGFDILDPAKPDAPLRPRPPHAHNEFLQLGTDFGVPGLLLFIGIYGMVAYMGHFVWNTGTFEARIVVVSALAGLLAHAVYGLGDAIPLWDRFAFLFWFLIGMIAACYVVVLADLKKD
jgi:O-antigen ligase